MEEFGFWHDFFAAYQAQPNWLKLLWLVVPQLFAFAFTALFLLLRLALKRFEHKLTGNLMYSVHRDEMDMFHVYLHGPEKELPGQGMGIDTEATIELLERRAAKDRNGGQAEKNGGG